jgi:hypothetical protein
MLARVAAKSKRVRPAALDRIRGIFAGVKSQGVKSQERIRKKGDADFASRQTRSVCPEIMLK